MKFGTVLICILLPFFIVNQTPPAAFAQSNKVIMGWLEKIVLLPYEITMTAKLDSGAATSSIHANNVEIFEKKGTKWVTFTLEHKNEKNITNRIQIERPLVRKVYIKRHGAKSVERAVVTLDFYINGKKESTAFSLANREKFDYPVLLGREFLKKNIIIDSEKTFLIQFDYNKLRNNKLGVEGDSK